MGLTGKFSNVKLQSLVLTYLSGLIIKIFKSKAIGVVVSQEWS